MKRSFIFLFLYFIGINIAIIADHKSLFHKVGDYTTIAGLMVAAGGVICAGGDSLWVRYKSPSNLLSTEKDEWRCWYSNRRANWKKLVGIGVGIGILGSTILAIDELMDFYEFEFE